jgi:hypothetical protein
MARSHSHRLAPSWLTLVAACAWVAACSGSEFSKIKDRPACNGSCAGEAANDAGASGETNEAGEASSAGAGNGPGPDAGAGPGPGGGQGGGTKPISSGAGGGGGQAGGGGASLGGLGGLGGQPGTFPSTQLLDNFNREGPGLLDNWIGATGDYAIKEQAAWCTSCTQAVMWKKAFGEQQEVFATLKQFDDDAGEINLVLKAQDSPACELIEVIYSPLSLHLRVAYCVDYAWTDLEPLSVMLDEGDRLGARAHTDGKVEIFRNTERLAEVDVSGFPYTFGRIGLNGVSSDNGISWDDFGGGDWK